MKNILRVLVVMGIACAVLSSSLPRPVVAWELKANGFSAPVEVRGNSGAEPSIAVKLDIDEDSLSGMSHREKLDQVRDWLLLTAISATGLPPERISEVTFDLPAVRRGYMRPVANYQYGVTRSAQTGETEVVALIPADTSAAESADLVAHVADEHRKDSGDMPGKILLFKYKIDFANRAAELTRSADVSARELFSPQYGYTETNVSNMADFARFMGEVDEVTFARLNPGGGGLTFGGRKLRGHAYRGIRVEDVAAIWKSEDTIARREQSLTDLLRRADEFESRWERKWREFNARWRAWYGKPVTAAVANQHKREKAELEAQEKREGTALLAEVQREKRTPQIARGSGFSLDPEYDYTGLLRFFDEAVKPGLMRLTQRKQGGFTLSELNLARRGLVAHDVKPFMRLLGKLVALGHGELANLIQALLREGYAFQKARYDGELQGTEVGMVLFYTDLLAKLWAMDFMESKPSSAIKEFQPITDRPVSPAFRQEIEELTDSRLWFGPHEKGFQVASDGQTLLLGHTATRVYAASATAFNPGVETTAAQDVATFLEWWDDHYEEIARHEPEYERLNEIMKWSLLIGWLNSEGKGELLGFLGGVPVNTPSRWFPDWVRQHPELKFQRWDEIKFFEHRDANGKRTEAMPLLFSKPYRQFGETPSLSGGVTLARKGILRERITRARAARDTNIGKPLRRAHVNPVKPTSPSEPLVMRAEDGTTYRLAASASGKKTVSVTGKPETRLRGKTGEVPNVPLRQTTSPEPGGFKVEIGAESVPIGRLDVESAHGAFRIGWRSRDMDAGQALARRVSRHPEPHRMLALDPQVEVAYKLKEPGQYLVKMRNSEQWMKVAEGGGGNIKPPRPPSKTTVADPGGDPGRRFELAWLKSEEVSRELGAGHIRVELVEQAVLNEKSIGQGLKLQALAGEPPPGATPVKITSGQEVINATIDPATGRLYLSMRELPPVLRNDPAWVGKRLQPSDVQEVTRLAKSSTAPVEYNTALRKSVDGITGETALGYKLIETGRYPEAIRHLSELIKTHENISELKVLRAIARLKQGRAKTATDELNALASQSGRNPAPFFDEVNSRLKSFYGPDDVYFAENGKTFNLHRRVKNSGQREEGIPEDADIYVQDSPELLGMDWSPSVSPKTVNEIIAGGLGRGSSLPPGGPGSFRPTVIYDEGGGRKYILKTRVRPGTPTADGQPRILGRHPIYGCYDDEDENEETECEELVSQRPVFLITDARRASGN
jgi:hypothetical protein